MDGPVSQTTKCFIQTQKEFDDLDWNVNLIGLDHEFTHRDTYFPVPSLVQLSTQKIVVAIDLLIDLDLSALKQLALDNSIRFICHDATSEMPLIEHVFRSVPENYVDTQLASSFLDPSKIANYASLVYEHCGITLDKGAQTSNWSRRPLSHNQLEYAWADAEHLIDVWLELQSQLHSSNKRHWYEEELALRRSQFGEDSPYPPSLVSKLPMFNPLQFSLLRELLDWRENVAVRLNKPRQWIASDAKLKDLAELGDTSRKVFRNRLQALSMHRWFKDLNKVFASWGRRIDNIPYVLILGKDVYERIYKDLRLVRDNVAAEVGVLPDLILRKKQTVDIVDAFRSHGGFPKWFGDWRLNLIGDDFGRVLASHLEPVNA